RTHALRLEHAPDLAHTLLTHLARQVMQHDGAEHRVEPRLRERQRLDDGGLKTHLQPALAAFEVARAIIAGDASIPTMWPVFQPRVRLDRQTSRSASDIEGGFTRREAGERDQALAERASPSVLKRSDDRIVGSGPVNHAT